MQTVHVVLLDFFFWTQKLRVKIYDFRLYRGLSLSSARVNCHSSTMRSIRFECTNTNEKNMDPIAHQQSLLVYWTRIDGFFLIQCKCRDWIKKKNKQIFQCTIMKRDRESDRERDGKNWWNSFYHWHETSHKQKFTANWDEWSKKKEKKLLHTRMGKRKKCHISLSWKNIVMRNSLSNYIPFSVLFENQFFYLFYVYVIVWWNA